MITIRLAKKTEMPWINKCYEKLEFVPSHFENELIAIAECNGEKAGIGRLATINERTLELGGMFVFPSFRKKGVAREIVKFLLEKANPSQTIYCIPFQHLLSFYKEFGFISCSDVTDVPEKLVKKFQWCKEKYSEPTALLVLKEEFKLYYKETPSAKEENALLEGVIEEAFKAKDLGRITPFAFFMKDKKEQIVAGIKGITLYGCLYIDMLWVDPLFRNQSWGSGLMKAAEDLGRERKCTFATLTTMDWEALPFYKKLGYEIEYTREGYEKHSQMHFLRKRL